MREGNWGSTCRACDGCSGSRHRHHLNYLPFPLPPSPPTCPAYAGQVDKLFARLNATRAHSLGYLRKTARHRVHTHRSAAAEQGKGYSNRCPAPSPISSHLISHLYLSIRVLVCILVLLFFSSLCVSCFLLLLVLLLSAAILCYIGDLTD